MILRIFRFFNFKLGGRSPKLLTTVLTNPRALAISAVVAMVTLVLGILLIRLLQCLPGQKIKRKKRLNTFNLRTMIIFGSGTYPRYI